MEFQSVSDTIHRFGYLQSRSETGKGIEDEIAFLGVFAEELFKPPCRFRSFWAGVRRSFIARADPVEQGVK
jgi:hypothetical protein